MKDRVLNILATVLFILFFGTIMFYGAYEFGINMRHRVFEKRELDSLKMENLKLTNEILKAQIRQERLQLQRQQLKPSNP